MATNAELLQAWDDADTLNNRTGANPLLASLIPAGLADRKVVFGEAAFTTTGTTVEVPCYTKQGEDLTVIESIIITAKAAFGEDTEDFYCDGVVTANSGAGNNTTTVSRTAGTTSGLAFWYVIIGY